MRDTIRSTKHKADLCAVDTITVAASVTANDEMIRILFMVYYSSLAPEVLAPLKIKIVKMFCFSIIT